MKKNIKKLNEFTETSYNLTPEVEEKVLSDDEIKMREDNFRKKEYDVLSNRSKKTNIPNKELFDKKIEILLNNGGDKNDVDDLSIKYYGIPYYKKNGDLDDERS